jgi:cell division protein FtsN
MQFFKNIGTAVLVQFVMSLIFAAIFKKEEPVFASIDEQEQE